MNVILGKGRFLRQQQWLQRTTNVTPCHQQQNGVSSPAWNTTIIELDGRHCSSVEVRETRGMRQTKTVTKTGNSTRVE